MQCVHYLPPVTEPHETTVASEKSYFIVFILVNISEHDRSQILCFWCSGKEHTAGKLHIENCFDAYVQSGTLLETQVRTVLHPSVPNDSDQKLLTQRWQKLKFGQFGRSISSKVYISSVFFCCSDHLKGNQLSLTIFHTQAALKRKRAVQTKLSHSR